MKTAVSDYERSPRPTTKGEAVRLIEATYRYNDWNDDEQAAHQRMLNLEPKALHLMTNDELKIILDRFEKSRMLIFNN
jgi:hypothetical protein